MFDASIDIADPGAAQAVRAGVGKLPGAGWISVEAHRGAEIGLRLFASGSGLEAEGGAWMALRRVVENEIRQALEAAHRLPAEASPGWATPAPMATGFAETTAEFEAMEQLATLAKLSRSGPPAPAPLPLPLPPAPRPRIAAPIPVPQEDAADVGRLARLLALVLPANAESANAGPAAEPAAAAIRRFGSYAAVLAAPQAELRAVPGLGTHSIAAIKLIHAAAIRLARAGITARPVLADRQRLYDYLATALARERIEQFRILFLDEKGMLRADEVQAQGTVNHTPVYPREVVRRALALEAASVVLVHNHPSGDPAPSREDIEMTKQVREAASVMKIGLRDHVIVGNGRWLSFREEGYLDG